MKKLKKKNFTVMALLQKKLQPLRKQKLKTTKAKKSQPNMNKQQKNKDLKLIINFIKIKAKHL